MTTYPMTGPDGAKYEVEADNVEDALKQLNAFRQKEVSDASNQDFQSAPAWAQPFLAAKDVARKGFDTISLGAGPKAVDKLMGTGDLEQMKTKAASDRMGLAGTAMDAMMAMRFLPTVVPKVVGALGGGPAARTVVGATTAGLEGGAYGGTSAAMHDEDPGTGAGIGAAAGVAGNVIGNIANRGKRLYDEYWLGKTFEPPQYNVKKLPPNPTQMDRINVADTTARDAAALSSKPMALQNQYRKEFADLLDTANLPRKTFTPKQRSLMEKLTTDEDPATTGFRYLGDVASNKLLGAGAFGAGLASGNVIPGMIGMGGLLGTGRALREISLGGTKEAANNLRRYVYGIPQFKGPVSEEYKARIGAALRQLGLENMDDTNP